MGHRFINTRCTVIIAYYRADAVNKYDNLFTFKTSRLKLNFSN